MGLAASAAWSSAPASTLSLRTLAMGARQLVVQEALETKVMSLVYLSGFTPQTNMGVSSLKGADITTFFAPASMWPWAFYGFPRRGQPS